MPGFEKVPAMMTLPQKYRSRGLSLIFIDVFESVSTATRFKTHWKLSEPFLVDSTGSAAASYSILVVPTIVVIDRFGKIRANHIGSMSAAEIEVILKRIP
jgi:predicted transcriptional regulator